MSSHRSPGLGAAKRPRSAHMTTTRTMPSTPLQNLKGHSIEPAHVLAVARSAVIATGTSRQTSSHRHPVHPESPSRAVLRPRSAFPGKSSACERSEANEAFLFRQRMSAHASATSAHRKSKVSRPESAPMRDRRASQSSFLSRGQQYARSQHRDEETAGSRLTQYLASLELRAVGSPSSSLRPATSSSSSKTSSNPETSSISPKIPLYTWGSNYYGQCSGTAGKDVASPHSCDHILEDADVGGADINDCVDRIYCSDKYTVAVCAGGGKVVCWGKPFGVQTDGTVLKVPSALVMGIPRVTELSCGQDHAVALLEGGLLVGWGSQASGALGPLDSLAQPSGPAMAVPLHRFMEVAPRIVGVRCGARFTLVLTNYGDIYGAGDNEFGQLGAGKASKPTCFTPVRMELPTSTSPPQKGPTIKQLACGDRHALVLTQDGLIWATGLSGCRSIADEERGELRNVSSQPQPIAIEVKTKVVSIDAAGHWSCATLGDGGIFAWDAACSSPIPLCTMRDKGASMRQAVITSSGSVVAVSYACNVYEWTNIRAAREPLVRSQFASQGVKVNFVAAGGGHFAAARLEHPGLRTFRFDPRPVEATVPCARASIVWGGGISKAVASRRASGQNEFQIQLKSKEGKIFAPRAEADAPEIHAGLWKDAACSHRIADADIRVRHIGKGRYMVSYGATQAGEMYMSVRLGGVHVGKSPYKLTNSPGSLHVASCVCSFVDAQRAVCIEERDCFGNRVRRPETGRAWTVQAYDADRDTMLWRGLPGARIPLLPGLSHIEVLHNDSQTVLQCQGGTLNQHSDNSSFCSQYQPTLQDHILLEGGEAVIRWVRPLECRGVLRISFTFRDGQRSIVEVAVREGMEQAQFTVPAISGGFAVSCELYTMILQRETAFPFMKSVPIVRILSQSAQSFATKRSLGASERIRSGFFFCKELQTDLSSSAGKGASAIEVNPVADTYLKAIVEESDALCKHLPPAAHVLRAKALAGIVADWSQESISGKHTTAKSRDVLKAGNELYLGKVLQEAMHVLNQGERTCLRAVLFKYLCDENSLTCAMTAAGDCCIGPSATRFSLTRPSLRPPHVQDLAHHKQEK